MLRSLGEQLKEARLQRKLSVNKLAQMVGVSHVFLSRLERGVVKAPSDETTQRIADVLDLSFDDLMLGAQRIPADIKDKFMTNKRYLPIFRALQTLDGAELQQVHDLVSQINLKRFNEE